jgi:O-acetyl-ADP-ribose deacetylase (regulator of RNase III)
MNVTKGDITTVASGMILQQVNCQGVMGSGVAKAIRDKWPDVYVGYKDYCESRNQRQLLGTIHVARVGPGLFVCNLFGQQFYGKTGQRYTSYDALDDALAGLSEWLEGYHSPLHIHYPTLGCGLGGGKWPVVQSLIQQHIGTHEQTLWMQ